MKAAGSESVSSMTNLTFELCDFATGAGFTLTPEFVRKLIGQLEAWQAKEADDGSQ
jgi:hypothetical protein